MVYFVNYLKILVKMKKFIDNEKLKKLAKLAKIEIRESEIEEYLSLLNNDLGALEALDNINTEGIEPLTNPYDMILREYPDIISDGDKVDELMKCTPKQVYNYFVVPKVIEK